ncbi:MULTISPECIES: SDR family oxidoreductase [Mesorhizobium]|uniref:SDR family oxidoreductase n=1 Tax=Mesorhizobium erdmanii TaxID=1777866 RepID=UPI001FCAB9F1
MEAALGEGATVLAVARGTEALKELAWEASGVKTLAADATQDTAPDAVFAAMQPDVLVVCAGAFAPSASIQDQSWEDFSTNWETDVKASFLFCRAALRGLMKPGSRVVLISSGAAFSGGPPNSGGYSGAKRTQMFLAAHSQKEADRLGLGLRFMALAPMRIMTGTGVGQRGISSISAYLGISPADFLASMTDVQTPADVGRAVVALAGGKAQGTAFTVSGSGLAAAA